MNVAPFEVRRQLTYKAEAKGTELVAVPPAYTSRRRQEFHQDRHQPVRPHYQWRLQPGGGAHRALCRPRGQRLELQHCRPGDRWRSDKTLHNGAYGRPGRELWRLTTIGLTMPHAAMTWRSRPCANGIWPSACQARRRNNGRSENSHAGFWNISARILRIELFLQCKINYVKEERKTAENRACTIRYNSLSRCFP